MGKKCSQGMTFPCTKQLNVEKETKKQEVLPLLVPEVL
jgi:hypothetical protein